MNNKLDKKHKPNLKQKQKQPKNKKKTTSRQSKKKKEIKSGGAFSLSGLFSRKNTRNSSSESELNPLLPPQQHNPNNAQQPLENQNPQPNVNPSGFNTITSQSRCSIL